MNLAGRTLFNPVQAPTPCQVLWREKIKGTNLALHLGCSPSSDGDQQVCEHPESGKHVAGVARWRCLTQLNRVMEATCRLTLEGLAGGTR